MRRGSQPALFLGEPARSDHMADTVLAHIAAANPQKENLATEALAFILNRAPAARSALHRKIVTLLGEVPPITRVVAQVAVREESRPDIVVLAGDGQTLGYIEAKFWAALTAAQPVKYVEHLTRSGGHNHLFLAPEQRLPTLRGEVVERLKAAGMAPADTGGLSMAVGSVRLGLLSWRTLLDALRDVAVEDRDLASDVHQLRGLVERFEREGFIPLTRVDLDDLDVPRRIASLTNLSWEIVDAACQVGILSVKGLKVTPRDYGGGRYAAFKAAGCWLGVDHEMWSTRGRSPIWIDFTDDDWGRAERLREPLRAWLSADPPLAFADDSGIQIPVLLAVGVEKERVIADAVRQIREVDARLRDVSPPLW
jgi:hypothetical protein